MINLKNFRLVPSVDVNVRPLIDRRKVSILTKRELADYYSVILIATLASVVPIVQKKSVSG